MPGNAGRGERRPGQLREEFLQPCRVESEIGRQLPEDRSELLTQREHTRRVEIREGYVYVAEFLHVADKPRPLDGEDELRRCLGVPRLVVPRPLKGVERAVDLHRRQPVGDVAQFIPLAEILWIEHAAPRRVSPAGYTHSGDGMSPTSFATSHTPILSHRTASLPFSKIPFI